MEDEDIGRESELLSAYASGKHKKKKKKKTHTNSDADTMNKNIKEVNIDHISEIDYVLVHSDKTEEEDPKNYENRKKFETLLVAEGINMDKEIIGDLVFIKLRTPFQRLCKEAERVKMQMPLQGCEIYEDDKKFCCGRIEDALFETDDSVDFISAVFTRARGHLFEGYEDPKTFFNPSLRGLLTHHVLINVDIRSKSERIFDTDGDGDMEEDLLAKRGLPYLLHKGSYSDAFTLHDESLEDPVDKEAAAELKKAGKEVKEKVQKELARKDTRKELNDLWPKVYKYQPMWKVRNYFGEKIAFYFAWSGTLVSTLWIPTLIGLGVFIYGLYLSATRSVGLDQLNSNATSNGTNSDGDFLSLALGVKDEVFKILEIIKEACDNDATPFFALAMCLWGTIFLEVWKRKSATLAYEWDVNDFEDTEPDRPQYFGTTIKKDPVSGELAAYYPIIRRILKFCFSFVFILVMIMVVFISVGGVIIYRVIMSVDYCGKMSTIECLLVTTIASSLLNAISIFILGKIYEKVAYLLTDWENHRTQTDYDDSLIVKLFAFQFANNYSSLFYIAFLRGNVGENGVLGLGPSYIDNCGDNNNCMSMLSFQVLVLMIVKPFPKLLKDILVPFIKKCIRNRKCCKKDNKIDPADKTCTVTMNDYLDRERLKPILGDFTLWEYTEKVIQYGYLMLFSVALPIAPLIALLTNLFDRGTDAKRLLWIYRRPLSVIAQDIGMWYPILDFINIVGVISNGFIIAFTSSFGKYYFEDNWERLIAAIVFEHLIFAIKYIIQVVVPDIPQDVKLAMRRHLVFGLKYLIAIMIPDVPAHISLAIRRERYQVSKILETGAFLTDTSGQNGSGDGGNKGQEPGRDEKITGSNNSLRRRHIRSQSAEELNNPNRLIERGIYPLLDEPGVDQVPLVPRPKKKKKKKRSRTHEDDPEDPDTPRRPHQLAPLDPSSEDPEVAQYDNPGRLPRLVEDKSELRKSPTWVPPPMVAVPAPVYMGDTSFDVTMNSSYA